MGSCASVSVSSSKGYTHVHAVASKPEPQYPTKPDTDGKPMDSAFSTLLVTYGLLAAVRQPNRKPIVIATDVKEAVHYMLHSIYDSRESFRLWVPRAPERNDQFWLWKLLAVANCTVLPHSGSNLVGLMAPHVDRDPNAAYETYLAPIRDFVNQNVEVFQVVASGDRKAQTLSFRSTSSEQAVETMRILMFDHLATELPEVASVENGLAFTVLFQVKKNHKPALLPAVQKVMALPAPVFVLNSDGSWRPEPIVTAPPEGCLPAEVKLIHWLPTRSGWEDWARQDVFISQMALDGLSSESPNTVSAAEARMKANQYPQECKTRREQFACTRSLTNPSAAATSTKVDDAPVVERSANGSNQHATLLLEMP